MSTVKIKKNKDVPSSQCIFTLSSVFSDRSGRHFLHILHHKAIIKNTRGKLQPFLSSLKGRRGGWKGRDGGRALLKNEGAKKRVVYAFQQLVLSHTRVVINGETVLHFEPGVVVISHFGSSPQSAFQFQCRIQKKAHICPKFGADVFGCVLV